jgi:hypothetical protein
MVIATRVLRLKQADGTSDIPIRIFMPEEIPGAWSCRYEIDWPGETRAHAASGVDSVQAIHIALQLIGSEIYASDYHRSGQLMFEPGAPGYGFPVPRTMRDVLVGDDAKFL